MPSHHLKNKPIRVFVKLQVNTMVKLKNVQSRKGVGVFICWTDLVTVAQSGGRTMYRFGNSCNIVTYSLGLKRVVDGDAADLVAAG